MLALTRASRVFRATYSRVAYPSWPHLFFSETAVRNTTQAACSDKKVDWPVEPLGGRSPCQREVGFSLTLVPPATRPENLRLPRCSWCPRPTKAPARTWPRPRGHVTLPGCRLLWTRPTERTSLFSGRQRMGRVTLKVRNVPPLLGASNVCLVDENATCSVLAL